MKNTLALVGMAGLTAILLSSSAIAQNAKETKDTKTSRHIKLMKIENGKKMELDTILTNNDVFVWHGDTIGGKKMSTHVSSLDLKKNKQIKVMVDGEDDHENVVIYRKKGGKSGNPMIMHLDSDEDMELLTEDSTSTGKRIVIRKRMKDGGDENQMIYFNSDDKKHFQPLPPMPPMPPMQRFKMLKATQAGRIIDLNDPNIISYKKKQLSGGREKIEIVRKKSKGPGDSSFDYKFDGPISVPGEPIQIKEFNDGDQNIKIIEKKLKKADGKDGKEIKVEVKPNENK